MSPNLPLVSICCITYNHEKYIRDAIEGFLIQKTTFPIEIIIHDDASSDNTASIVKEYATKYPELIVPIYQTVNQYSQGIKPWPNFVFPRARGKYIALCEGDDYWTDPLKLQKQVDFLEENEEYGLVHTDNDIKYQKNGKDIKSINKKKYSNLKNVDYPAKRILLGSYAIHTLTVLFRKKLLEKVDFLSLQKYKIGDLPLWLSISQFTKFYYIDESTAVYRVTEGSASNPFKKNAQLLFQIEAKKIRMDFARMFNIDKNILNIIEDKYYKALLIKAFNENNKFNAKNSFIKMRNKTFTDYMLHIGSSNTLFNFIFMHLKKIRILLLIWKKY